MSKKVLVLSASPRKGGNSDTLCDAFIRGAQEAGNQAEKIFLRYYERIGLIPPVARNKGGTREYTSKDLCWIEFIKTMRSAGLSPETLIEYVALSQLGDTTLEARKDILELQREVLQEKLEFIQQTLARIDIKIENYRTDIYQKNHPLQNQKQEEADL